MHPVLVKAGGGGVSGDDRSLSPPSVPWRVIKTDDSDAVPSDSVSTAQPFAPSFIPPSSPL